MIKVDSSHRNGGLEPLFNPLNGFGSHFDGKHFYFFESETERDILHNKDLTVDEQKKQLKTAKKMQTQTTNDYVKKPVFFLKKPFYNSAKKQLKTIDLINSVLSSILSVIIFYLIKITISIPHTFNVLTSVFFAFLIINFFKSNDKK